MFYFLSLTFPPTLLKFSQQSQFMKKLGQYRVAYSIIVLATVAILATIAIFYARGFKPNLQNGTIDRTGLIVANSTPTGANVYIDGRLASATNTTITYLEPKTYQIRIEKDGYSPWEKSVEIKEDLATEIHALLFPLAPEIKPLTITGAVNPTLSPDGTEIAYGVSGEKGGIWILPMESSPFSFRQNARQVAKNTSKFDFSKSTFIWDPDSKQLITRFVDSSGNATANLLLDTESANQEPRDITASLTATLASWQQIINERTQTATLNVPDAVKNATASASVASPSPASTSKPTASPAPKAIVNTLVLNYFPTGMILSPNEEKILYKNNEGKYKVYNLKEEKEFTLPDLPQIINISWFPDSDHLVIAQNGSISIIESDGTNNITVYTGKFENGFVFAHPSATRLIILTTLTQQESSPANLYSINLR